MTKEHLGFSERTAFSHYYPERFTAEEREVLAPFFSNLNRPVYAVSGLPPEVVAALFGRQSQTDIPPRRLFLEEFVGEGRENTVPVNELVKLEKAREFLRKNFVERGHGSLIDLVTVPIGFEAVSQIGAKALEDGRIGVAPLERSTRYGRFDQKGPDRKYKYVRDPEIMASKHAQLFCRTTDELIATYASLIDPVKEALRKKYPKKGNWWVDNRTLDLVRVLLPASVCTNLGLVLDGRATEHLVIKLKSSDLAETQELGGMIASEVEKVSPAVVGRVQGGFGESYVEYLKATEAAMASLAGEILPDFEIPQGARVELVDWDEKGEEKVIAAMLWRQGKGISEQETREKVRKMSIEEKERIVETYIGKRQNRHQLPERALERTYYKFEIVAPFGIYRDLQRHRILTQERQALTFDYGYEIPEELIELGFGEIIREKTEKAMEAYYGIEEGLPNQAQYMATFGALTSWYVWLNLREGIYLTELRTGKGVHPRYKKVAQEIKKGIERVHPIFSPCFKFVDLGD